MRLFSILFKQYKMSHNFEKKEVIYILFSLIVLTVVTIVSFFHILKIDSIIFAMLEVFNLLLLGISFYLLLKGSKNSSSVLLFPVFGNINLLKIILTAEFLDFPEYMISPEIFNSFQVLIIIAVAYFCKKKLYILLTFIVAVVCNYLYLFDIKNEIFMTDVASKAMFIVVPTLFALHINSGNKLLENYYKTNINKDREVNHRIKNQLSLLQSILSLKTSHGEYNSDSINKEIFYTITSFIKIYDKLLHSENIHQLKLSVYLKSIIAEYCSNLSIGCSFVMSDEEFIVDAEKGTQIGMIISELISNSIKHAETENLQININIECGLDDFLLIFTDNGKTAKLKKSPDSYGKVILMSIVEDSLKGKYEVIDKGHYENRVTIPILSLLSGAIL